MEIIPMLLKEMNHEAETTRKMLSIVPAEKFDWQPHPKSMSLIRLAAHVAELPGWVTTAINTDELDFGKADYKPTVFGSTSELLDVFEKNLAEAQEALSGTNEQILKESWTMRNGEEIYYIDDKVSIIRHAYCQTVHHRAQLGVFLRLLNIPIPGSYGPSADEM
jgi:uncharacterized damage-inducible protein DinB